MRARFFKSLWRSRRGTALVESAIILPVFLALVGGVYEFSYFIYQQQLAAAGVRDAARFLALSADPTGGTYQNEARNLAVTGSIVGDGPARVSGWSAQDVAIAVNTVYDDVGTSGNVRPIRIVTVTTDFTDPSLGFLGLLRLNKPTISVSHQERYVGGSAPAPG
jgi:Flp pilus assembly protein TadG